METPKRIEHNLKLRLFLFQMKQQHFVQNSNIAIISGANFPKVMFIVF